MWPVVFHCLQIWCLIIGTFRKGGRPKLWMLPRLSFLLAFLTRFLTNQHNYPLAWLYHNITSLLWLQRKGERRSKKSHDPLPSSIDDPIKRGRDKDHVVEGAGKKTKISCFCYVGISLKVRVISIARLPTFISSWVPKTYQEVQKSFSKQYAIYV